MRNAWLNRGIVAAFVMLLSFSQVGCELPDTLDGYRDIIESELFVTTEEASLPEEEQNETAESTVLSGKEIIEGNDSFSEDGYYYSLLSSEEQTVYQEVVEAIQNRSSKQVSTLSEDILKKTYQAFLNDHPEVFYLQGYTFTKHMVGDKLDHMSVEGKFAYTAEEIAEKQAQVDAVVDQFLQSMPEPASDYEKSKLVYEYLVKETTYQQGVSDNQNYLSVFLEHKSVCNGYAKAAQYMFHKMGIPCIVVNGDAGGDKHAWNMVVLDGSYCEFDATWGDMSYHGEGKENAPEINYSYLNLSSEMMGKTHAVDGMFPVPKAESDDHSYYQQEGRYFTSYDKEQLKAVALDSAEDGVIRIQARDEALYQELYQSLIEDQDIFDYLEYAGLTTDGNLSFVTEDELYTLSFWK